MRQWAAEIKDITPALRHYLYHGEAKTAQDAGLPHIQGVLTREHDIFKSSENGIVVITSFETLRSRHGPKSLKKYLLRTGYIDDTEGAQEAVDEMIAGRREIPHDCPANIKGLITIMALDEVHRLKNLKTEAAKTISLIGPYFKVCTTATPVSNVVDDFAGILRLLEYPEDVVAALETNYPKYRQENGYNPYRWPDNHMMSILRCQEANFDSFVLKNDSLDDGTRGKWLALAMRGTMIRRTYVSRMPLRTGSRIAEELPTLHSQATVTYYSKEQRDAYDAYESARSTKLFKKAIGRKKIRTFNQRVIRQLFLYPCWSGFAYLEAWLKAGNDMKKARLDTPTVFIHKCIEKVVNGRKASGTDTPECPAENQPTALIEFVLRESPKLRALFAALAEQVVKSQEKAIVWVMYPATQLFIEKLICCMEINARSLHSDLKAEDKVALQKSFNTPDKTSQVLIVAYPVQVEWLNLHKECVFILCNYKASVNFLRAKFAELMTLDKITRNHYPTVSTVDSSMSLECKVSIVDIWLVRADRNCVGFTTSRERCTVALTRAEEALIMVGGTLERDAGEESRGDDGQKQMHPWVQYKHWLGEKQHICPYAVTPYPTEMVPMHLSSEDEAKAGGLADVGSWRCKEVGAIIGLDQGVTVDGFDNAMEEGPDHVFDDGDDEGKDLMHYD